MDSFVNLTEGETDADVETCLEIEGCNFLKKTQGLSC